jgi:hypothetical protein
MVNDSTRLGCKFGLQPRPRLSDCSRSAQQQQIVSLEEGRLIEINRQVPQLLANVESIAREIEQEELLQLRDAAADIVDNMWERGRG